jgi:hypothetical protein
MHYQLWGYKVEEKIYVGERERKSLNVSVLDKCQYKTTARVGCPNKKNYEFLQNLGLQKGDMQQVPY